jgi:hypothetical protein
MPRIPRGEKHPTDLTAMPSGEAIATGEETEELPVSMNRLQLSWGREREGACGTNDARTRGDR